MVSKVAFAPLRLGPLTLKNRFVKAATFEGVMPRGRVSDALIDFHSEVARGGVAMTTVAYCPISPGGRVHRDTVVLDRDRVSQLRRLTDAHSSSWRWPVRCFEIPTLSSDFARTRPQKGGVSTA